MSYYEKFLNLIVEFITMSKGRYNTTVLDYGYLSKKYPTMKQFFEEEYGIDENTDEKTYRQLLFNIVNFPFEYWSPTYITDEKVLLFFYCGDYENGKLSSKRLSEEFIKREASNIWDYMWKRFDDIDEITTVAELVYRMKHKIEVLPKCPVCGNRIPFNSDYSATFCSKKCKMSEGGIDIWQNKFNETMLDRYGTTIAFHNEELLEKMKQTTFEHYGVRCIFASDECKEQRDETMMEKYGCTVPYNIEEVREKMRQTNLERYGTEYPQQNEEIKKKIVDTRYERYYSGTEEANAAKAEMIEKTKQTLQERYGVDTPMKCPEFLEKSKATSCERYGVDFYTQTDECKQRVQQTNIERYGVPSYAQTKEYIDYMKNLNQERYGVDWFMQTEEFKEKSIETNRERY